MRSTEWLNWLKPDDFLDSKNTWKIKGKNWFPKSFSDFHMLVLGCKVPILMYTLRSIYSKYLWRSWISLAVMERWPSCLCLSCHYLLVGFTCSSALWWFQVTVRLTQVSRCGVNMFTVFNMFIMAYPFCLIFADCTPSLSSWAPEGAVQATRGCAG